MVTWESIVSLAALIGATMTIVLNWRKIGSKTKEDAVFQAKTIQTLEYVSNSLKDINTKFGDLSQNIQIITKDIAELRNVQSQHDVKIEFMETAICELRKQQ